MTRKITLFVILIVSLFVSCFGYNYCQAPDIVPSEDTNGMKLQFLQILTRHGDRTPTWVMPQEPVWDCTLNWLELFSNDVLSQETSPPRLYRRTYLPGRESLPGNCSIGQLTKKGLDQHFAMGAAIRDMYVGEYQFLPSQLNLSQIYIRSTDVPRTIQSVQANLWTMYPPESRTGEVEVINIHTMDVGWDDMTPNANLCPRYNEVVNALVNRTAWKQQDNSSAPLLKQLEQILNISAADMPIWGGMWDNFGARICHELPLPVGLTLEMTEQIYDMAAWQLNYTWSDSESGRLGSGMLLQEIYERIQAFLAGEESPLLVFYSGHDSTLGPLMATLGTFSGWPPYASHVIIEVWSDQQGDTYIQVKYNGEVITLPGCSGVMCPYMEFQELMEARIPSNFAKECQITKSFHSVPIRMN